MAVGVKAAAFGALVRIFGGALLSIDFQWRDVLWVMAVFTMTFGNIVAISQTNIKRMLAYSSIAHAGYILVGIIAGGDLGWSAVLYYLLAYTCMNLGAFGVVIFYGQKEEAHVEISDYAGLGFKYPFLGAAMAIFLFSLAGMPPLAGFVGKFYIFSAAIKSGYIWLTIIGVMNSLISVFYYFRVTVIMYMKEPVKDIALEYAGPIMIVLIITLVGTIQMGLFPTYYLEKALNSIQWLV
jgi:NADH-quinone oxidoreductase subunit N